MRDPKSNDKNQEWNIAERIYFKCLYNFIKSTNQTLANSGFIRTEKGKIIRGK